MEDHLGSAVRHEVDELRRPDVEAVEAELAVALGPGFAEVGQRAGGQVVDDVDLTSLREQTVDEGASNEAGATCNQYSLRCERFAGVQAA